MSAMRRLVLSGAIAALGLAAAVAAALFFDIDRHKARLEAAASQLLGMQVRIGGPLGMAFVPGLQVTANEVQIGLNGLELASAKQARIAIDILPLLRGQLQIGAIALESPRIAIERDRQGHFNFEATGADTATLPALDWPSVSLTHAALVYADKQSAELVSASDCRMDLHRVRLAGGKPSELLRGLSFTAELACTELRGAGLVMSALKSQIEVKDGAVDLKPLTMNVLGAPGAGSVRADFSGSVPSYSVRYALPQFAIEEFFKALSPKKIASGRMDFSANLKMHGSTAVSAGNRSRASWRCAGASSR